MPEAVLRLERQPRAAALLRRLQAFFARRAVQAHLVGGFPRDLALGRPAMDIDIAIAADALVVGRELARALQARPVVLDEANGVLRLILLGPEDAGLQIDLSTIHGSLLEDLRRRDFTLDALACDVAALAFDGSDVIRVAIFDPLGGLDDIAGKMVRAAGGEVFRQDAVRLLRAVRLAAELGFKIEAGTERLIMRDRLFIQQEAGERVREELLRLLRLTATDETLLYMQRLGLLTAVIPELEPSVGLEQCDDHQWQVFEHSARSVAAFDFLLRRAGWPYADAAVLRGVPWDAGLAAHFQMPISPISTHRELGKLAAVLHDIAKPQTRTISRNGKLRFYGHPQQGAPVAVAIMERLRFSAREKKLVELMVCYHLRPVQMGRGDEMPSRRAVYRFGRDLGEAAPDVLFFSLADHLATRGSRLDLTNWRHHVNIVAYVLEERAREASEPPVRLIDGHDLQRELGLSPGPRLGKVLAELREAQAAGEIASRDEALQYAEQLISKPE